MTRDLHSHPFDEGTKIKLMIFQEYLKEWLSVFLARKTVYWSTVNIFDFFAGPGSDSQNVKGTPLIILEEVKPYLDTIQQKGIKLKLLFNEYDPGKHSQLNRKVDEIRNQRVPFEITTESLDFKEAFDKYYSRMTDKSCANLLFLDQSGVKHITEDIFLKIIGLRRTDFLFFISSSTIKRFADHPAIQQYFDMNHIEIVSTEYDKIHRKVTDYYKSLLPDNKRYYLAPFSIKKGSGLYGIIFGSGHILGMEKFLATCWKMDPARGEANFDIDEDKISPGQFELFTGRVKLPKKVEAFEAKLREAIIARKIDNDKELYLFTVTSGFTPKHARAVIRELVREKKLKKSNLDLSSNVMKPNAETKPLELEDGN